MTDREEMVDFMIDQLREMSDLYESKEEELNRVREQVTDLQHKVMMKDTIINECRAEKWKLLDEMEKIELAYTTMESRLAEKDHEIEALKLELGRVEDLLEMMEEFQNTYVAWGRACRACASRHMTCLYETHKRCPRYKEELKKLELSKDK